MERLGIKKYNPKITQFNKMKAKIIFMATLAAAVLTACNNDENNVIDTGSSQATFTAAMPSASAAHRAVRSTLTYST